MISCKKSFSSLAGAVVKLQRCLPVLMTKYFVRSSAMLIQFTGTEEEKEA